MGSVLEKNSTAVRKRIEGHTFSGESGEEYEASEFGGFGDYFRRKKVKLQNLDSELRACAGDKPQIFKGMVVHVMGYTQPPLHILHKELVQHGAGFLQYLDSKTMATHIIASILPPKKTVDYSRYRIVRPAWVTDSIAAGKLLPWSDYRLIDEGPRQKTIRFDGGKMVSQATHQAQARYKEQSESGFYASQLRKPVAASGSPNSSTSFALQAGIQNVDRPSEGAEGGDAILLGDDGAVTDAQLPPDAKLVENDHQADSEVNIEVAENYLPLANPKDSGSHQEFLDTAPSERTESPQSTRPTKEMTSEEHNALLLTDPRIKKASSANPEFLKQFYSESRLHHLSTWKAELKSKMQKLANERARVAKVVKRRPGTRRYIMHVDFDSFFCAVSLKKAPQYVNEPAVVAHGTGAGSEIASCNYPARRFGLKNGMWMKKALGLCPELHVLPYDFPAYEEASSQFYESILDLGGTVQSVSVDEALVDITAVVLEAAGSDGHGVSEGSIWKEQENASEIASGLRAEIKRRTGCEVSIGIGGNILLAKVALRKAKPAGQWQIKPDEVLDILGDVKVEDLPGVAYSIGGKLEEIGIKLVKDIRQVSKERLVSVLGPKTGEKLWEYSRGIDRTEVGEQSVRKSVSAEVSWGIRFINQQEAEEFVFNLCKELERRLLHESVKGKHLTMKIMRRALDAPLDPQKHLGHGKCDTFNKSVAFGRATHGAETIGREAVSILRSFKFSPGDLRGLGVQLTKLEPIKASLLGPEGSQKKISFGAFSTLSTKKPEAEAIEDDGSPLKSQSTPSSQVSTRDPIADDPLTPRKPKAHPALALAKASETDGKAQSPLNVAGTQFVMPAHPDLGAMAELPKDIRSRLMAQGRHRSTSASRDASPGLDFGIQSPAPSENIPPDIDAEVFNALPGEMKGEVLASYRLNGSHAQVPQVAHKEGSVHTRTPKKLTTPSKQDIQGIGMASRAEGGRHDVEPNSPFLDLATPQERYGDEEYSSGDDNAFDDELDPEFLAELPDEVRQEVLTDHRRRRRAEQTALNAEAMDDEAMLLPGTEMNLEFPAKPPKASFNSSALSSERELKDMLRLWLQETQEDGPHRADVEMFEKYLVKVVLEERDMEKARNLVRWISWAVDESTEGKGKRLWKGAVNSIREAMQKAARRRGLGPMDLWVTGRS